MTRPRRHGALAALAAAALLAAPPAAADPLAVTLRARAGRVTAAVDLAPLLPPGLDRELRNGLRNVVAIFVALTPAGSEAPALGRARVLEVLYDVWEETWSVVIRDAQSPAGRRQVVRSATELRALLARGADVDLGPVADLPAVPFTVDVRIDVNPISPELLARTREYLAASPTRGSRSVLGAVAGMWLRSPGEGREAALFRSRPLSAGEVQPR